MVVAKITMNLGVFSPKVILSNSGTLRETYWTRDNKRNAFISYTLLLQKPEANIHVGYKMEIFAKNTNVRLKVGLDIDNVTADTAGLLVEILRRQNSFKELKMDHITHRPFHESSKFKELGISKEMVSGILDSIWRDHFKDIPLMDKDIGKIIGELRGRQIFINVITTMGARDHSIRPNLQIWLEGKGIAYDREISFVEGNVEKILAPLHTIVDDEEKLAEALAKGSRPGIIYDRPWNRNFIGKLEREPNPLIHTVSNWEGLGSKILELQKGFRS